MKELPTRWDSYIEGTIGSIGSQRNTITPFKRDINNNMEAMPLPFRLDFGSSNKKKTLDKQNFTLFKQEDRCMKNLNFSPS